jgi:hypothetical protein
MMDEVRNSCWACRGEINAPDQSCSHCGATVNLTTRRKAAVKAEAISNSTFEASARIVKDKADPKGHLANDLNKGAATSSNASPEAENEPIADQISKLAALHQEGSLTAKEFQDLKETVIRRSRSSISVGEIRPNPPVEPKAAQSILSSLILPALLVGMIWLDHARGPLFPDNWYCAIGAGTGVREPGYTQADSWSANNGCGPRIPGCATG